MALTGSDSLVLIRRGEAVPTGSKRKTNKNAPERNAERGKNVRSKLVQVLQSLSW